MAGFFSSRTCPRNAGRRHSSQERAARRGIEFQGRSMRKTVVFGLLASTLAMVTIASAPPRAFAQEPTWRNDWTITAPLPYAPVILEGPQAGVVVGSDGDLLLGAATNHASDYRLARLDTTGQLRWIVDVGGFQAATFFHLGQLLAEADGGAFAALDTDPGIINFVTKIDAGGAIAWTRPVPALWLADASPNRVAATDCRQISVLDCGSGDVVWQHQMTAASGQSCTAGGVSADDQANLYASFTQYAAFSAAVGFRAVKFDANGDVTWDTALTGTSGATLVGPAPGATLVYAYDNVMLYALRTGDGSVAWTAPIELAATVLLTPDSTAEPIVVGSATVQRVAAYTGQPRWTQTVSSARAAAVVGDAIVVNSSDGVLKLDASSGDIVWTGSLPTTDPSGNVVDYTAFGGLQLGEFLAVAYAYSPQSYSSAGLPPFLQRVGFDSGQPAAAITVPSTAQGMLGASIQEDAEHVVGVAIDQSADSLGLRVRRLSAVDGSVLWEKTEPVDPSFRSEPDLPGAVVAGDAVAAAYVQNSGSPGQTNNFSLVWVALYDRTTGDRRWAVALPDFYQERTTISTPAADEDGNIVVAVGTFLTGCAPGQLLCPHQLIYKLSAVDGSVLWRTDNEPFGVTQVLPQSFAVQGTDVMVSGPFTGDLAGSSLVRRSGADGSALWTSDAVGPNGALIYPVDDGNVVIVGSGWAKLDAATGTTLWAFPPPDLHCTADCSVGNAVVLPGGDILSGGGDGQQAWLVRLRGDGSGIADTWNLGAGNADVRSFVSKIEINPQGRIWLRLRSGFVETSNRIAFLGQFDIETGTLLSEQAFDTFESDPLSKALLADLLGPPNDNRLMIATQALRAPFPVTTGNAAIDTTIRANGDLSMRMTLDQTHVMPGDRVSFHLIVDYAGDAAVTGASLFARMPWPSGLEGLSCSTQAASNCVVDGTSGNVRASFDMLPGGEVDITGQLQVPDTDPASQPTPYGFVRGPTELNETGALNNFATAPVMQSLFFDGFEQRSPAH
ncbi:MAG: PQQ-binding-like beta-propeller repeat protein [Dokdonella sp.]